MQDNSAMLYYGGMNQKMNGFVPKSTFTYGIFRSELWLIAAHSSILFMITTRIAQLATKKLLHM